jgi:hypothetical protein
VPTTVSPRSAKYRALAIAAGAAFVAALSACQAPFGLGEPSTRALENGVEASLTASSFEITGSYTESDRRVGGTRAGVSIDLQLKRPDTRHLVISRLDLTLEAILVGDVAYFRGNQFLSQHMGTDPVSRTLVKAAGNAWWKGSAADVPRLADFTDGASFRSTFLGTAVKTRSDHVTVDGVNAIELSGPRAVVSVGADPPYRLLRVGLLKGVVVDGVSEAVLGYSFAGNFGIASPTDVIDFSNLSTLPPIYTVVSVDTSGCGSPCVVSALLKNLGGKTGAKAPSTITFTMTDSATRASVGSCQAQVQPDVGYNATTKVSCTISAVGGQPANAAIVTATPDNPGRA